MSGKFKKEVARSMTLSQISCFSGIASEDPQSQGDILGEDEQGQVADFDRHFGSIKLSNSNTSLFKMGLTHNIPRSECDYDGMVSQQEESVNSLSSAAPKSCNERNSTNSNKSLKSSTSEREKQQQQQQSRVSRILECNQQQQQVKNQNTKQSLFKQQFEQKQQNKQLGLEGSSSYCSNSNYQSNSSKSSNYLNQQFKQQGEQLEKLHEQVNDNQDIHLPSQFINNNNTTTIPSNTSISPSKHIGFLQLSSASSRISEKSKSIKILKNNTIIPPNSILYTSSQLDSSCSVSLRIIKENRKANEHQKSEQEEQQQLQQLPLGLNLFIHARRVATQERQLHQKIVDELTQASVSRMNYVNCRSIQLLGRNNSPRSRSSKEQAQIKHTCKYIKNKLRLIDKAPFASVEIVQGSTRNEQQNKLISSSTWKGYQSKTPSLIQMHSHFLTKYSLNIDALSSKDICLNTDEAYSVVLPLDAHFQSAILIGTFSGKILLYGLSLQQNNSRRYVQKLNEQIFQNGAYATSVCQVKAMLILGGSDGSIVFYDCKYKKIVKVIHCQQDAESKGQEEYEEGQEGVQHLDDSPPSGKAEDGNNQKISEEQKYVKSNNNIKNNNANTPLPPSSIGNAFKNFFKDINNLEDSIESNGTQESFKKLNNQSIRSLQANGGYLLLSRQSGQIELRDITQYIHNNSSSCQKSNSIEATLHTTQPLQQINDPSVIFCSTINNLLKCDFSCNNSSNIIILTPNNLQLHRAPTNKVLFKQSVINICSIFSHFADFTVNNLTKEIIVLCTETTSQTSMILVMSNISTKLRTIDILTLPYMLERIELDQSNQHLFCIAKNNQLKIWRIYNKAETLALKRALLDKFEEEQEEQEFDTLSTNESSPCMVIDSFQGRRER